MTKCVNSTQGTDLRIEGYEEILADLAGFLDEARRATARTINALMTATYWVIGFRIVEHEQDGSQRAGYGEEIIRRLSEDLSARFGRGFGRSNLFQMKAFYLAYREKNPLASQQLHQRDDAEKVQTASVLLTTSLSVLAACFPLSWSHYTKLLSVANMEARAFYESEAIRGGWTVRQLGRQIGTQFYERTALSRDKAAMLQKGAVAKPEDTVRPEEAIKDPYLLEFLDLKDEYSESDLEEAIIQRLEKFLLELGPEFTFVGRQRRLRIGNAWYRVDLVFFHRLLRCLVIVDLKLGELTHADAGQMHLYCNYAREHWTLDGENPPVGLILCAQKDAAMAHYALEGLKNKVLAAEYRTALPDEKTLAAEIDRTRRMLDTHRQPQISESCLNGDEE